MVQLFKVPLDSQEFAHAAAALALDEHWDDARSAMPSFPAVYACDAFVDMSSYGWGGAEAQKWVDQATLLLAEHQGCMAFVPREQRTDDLRALRIPSHIA